ncbi:hypothetical protein GPDM_06410 [Planococcus donghaensis MPA1U2]|uniref:Uncharacterized protein n=1 Tax=Planococcus donghaensis MPA1U2 TaxID=933115 RepID=E7RFN6_9BACL|nr:hypothetical protein GPDM_06410 [Planococcus donghaensis MPA1U2]
MVKNLKSILDFLRILKRKELNFVFIVLIKEVTK